MPSFLNFYLDLEANAEVITPQYTTNEAVTYIRVVSDAPMIEIYNMKIVDALGIEHNLSSHNIDGLEFDLEIIFGDYPLGKTTFYATIRDSVGNTKDLVPKQFEIYKATLLFVEVSDSQDYKILLKDSSDFNITLSDEGGS